MSTGKMLPMSSDRPTRDEALMEVARVISLRGTCERASIGAVIARDGRIISSGYVGAPSGSPHCTDVGCDLGNHGGCIRTVHAESNAIAFAAKFGQSTDGDTLYTTVSPCNDCAKLIINAGIARVAYARDYRDPRGLKMLADAGIPIEQVGPVNQVW